MYAVPNAVHLDKTHYEKIKPVVTVVGMTVDLAVAAPGVSEEVISS